MVLMLVLVGVVDGVVAWPFVVMVVILTENKYVV
jgi:hypothetical protein